MVQVQQKHEAGSRKKTFIVDIFRVDYFSIDPYFLALFCQSFFVQTG